MSDTRPIHSEKLGSSAYVIGGLSFIPMIGVLFGIIAIVWGATATKRGGKRLMAIGAGGILFTLTIYGALFYFGFVQRGGVFDGLRVELARSSLDSLVPVIEYYRVQNGQYPDSLKVLQESLPKNGFVVVVDPSVPAFEGQWRYFFYERVGEDHYYLRGVGADEKPFTADDILPKLPPAAPGKPGLLIHRSAA